MGYIDGRRGDCTRTGRTKTSAKKKNMHRTREKEYAQDQREKQVHVKLPNQKDHGGPEVRNGGLEVRNVNVGQRLEGDDEYRL